MAYPQFGLPLLSWPALANRLQSNKHRDLTQNQHYLAAGLQQHDRPAMLC
jgi:hypothetical protein